MEFCDAIECSECGELCIPVYPGLPWVFMKHDQGLSWKTGAILPKKGVFRDFEDMPTDLAGTLRLYYSNGMQRFLPSINPFELLKLPKREKGWGAGHAIPLQVTAPIGGWPPTRSRKE